MTDTRLLKRKIKESGLKLGFIAEFIGISRQVLWKKINNKSPFNQFEIEKACAILKIKGLKEKEAIFFAENVD